MKTHGRLQASVTVETALILPIVFGVMFAVLFLILVMFQNTVQVAVLDNDALQGANIATNPYVARQSAGYIALPVHDSFGFIGSGSNYLYKDGLSVYNLNLKADTVIMDQVISAIRDNLNNELQGFYILKQDVNTDITGISKGSVIVGGLMDTPANPILGAPGGSGAGVFGSPDRIKASGTAPVIDPSQFIRETDSKCAILTAYNTIWDSRMNQFLSEYLAGLFIKGTFES